MQLDEMIQQHTVNLLPELKAEVFDFILFLEQKNRALKSTSQSRQQLKNALNEAVALNMLIGIDGIDGVDWQREQRQDAMATPTGLSG